jgi:hypothetical protein
MAILEKYFGDCNFKEFMAITISGLSSLEFFSWGCLKVNVLGNNPHTIK